MAESSESSGRSGTAASTEEFFHQAWKNYRRSGYDFFDYLGFSEFWHLPMTHIANSINAMRGRPKKVYTLKQLAAAYDVPIHYTREPNHDDVVALVRDMEPDLIVSACFDHVIRKRLIAVPKLGVINVHPALLPDYRGPFPGLWQAIHGCDEVGTSVHYVDSEELDVGPIIKQKKIKRLPGEFVLGLDCRLYRLGIECAIETIQDIDHGIVHAVEQDPNAGAYYAYPSRVDLQALKRQNVPLYRRKDFIAEFL